MKKLLFTLGVVWMTMIFLLVGCSGININISDKETKEALIYLSAKRAGYTIMELYGNEYTASKILEYSDGILEALEYGDVTGAQEFIDKTIEVIAELSDDPLVGAELEFLMSMVHVETPPEDVGTEEEPVLTPEQVASMKAFAKGFIDGVLVYQAQN